MLILTRKIGEEVYIDENIRIKICKLSGSRVQLGIEAPEQVLIQREELRQRKSSSNASLNTTMSQSSTCLTGSNTRYLP